MKEKELLNDLTICENSITEIMSKGYEECQKDFYRLLEVSKQLKKENEELKALVDEKSRFYEFSLKQNGIRDNEISQLNSAQNKLAVEKLEEVRGNSHWFCENQISVDHFNEVLDEMLADLKGVKNDK